jgi:dimethyl sulfoxide reductase membrane subunit
MSHQSNMQKAAFWIILVFLGMLAATGYNPLISLLKEGHSITDLTNRVHWGVFISSYAFLVGLSAGGIMVAGVVYAYGFTVFRPIARVAEILAIGCLILAGITISIDIGRPERIFYMVRSANFSSPLIWNIAVIAIYMILAMAMGYFSTRAALVDAAARFPKRKWLYLPLTLFYTNTSESARRIDEKILKAIAIVSIPTAIALHSVTGWIFGLMKGVPGWHTELLAPIFIASAAVSGISLIILMTGVMRRVIGYDIPKETALALGKVLWYLIPVLGYFLFAEFLTVSYAGEEEAGTFFHELMHGSFAPLFWANLIGGIVLPFLILTVFPGSGAAIGVAGLLAFLGVFVERANIIIPPILNRAMMPYPAGTYMPTSPEIWITISLYALGAFVVLVLAKVFPLAETDCVRKIA